MTEPKFTKEPYLQQLTTKVSAVDGQWFECEETIFYPNGGGQPGDVGEMIIGTSSFAIIDTRKGAAAGTIRHQLDQEGVVKVGDSIQLVLNWSRRYRLMRMHSALHLLCSLIPRGVTGGSVGEYKSRLDFDLGEHSIDKQALTDQLNGLVAQQLPISHQLISQIELDENPNLVRTLSVQPPRGAGDIRLISVEGVDLQPCGGTHVRNTAEIGELLVSKIENKGKRNRRVHLVFADD